MVIGEISVVSEISSSTAQVRNCQERLLKITYTNNNPSELLDRLSRQMRVVAEETS